MTSNDKTMLVVILVGILALRLISLNIRTS